MIGDQGPAAQPGQHEALENASQSAEAVSAFSLTALRGTPRYTYLVAAVAALGGMLFGYDIGVISGAENLLKSSFRLSSTTEELAVSAVLIGAVIGGVIGGRLADRFSRRRALIALAILYGAAAILTAFSWNLGSFLAFRIITGVAVGASSLIVPAYIAEMSPARIRGGLVVLQQLAISFGILLSYALDFAFDSAGWGWRPMFGFAVLPALALAIGMLFMSYSPRWLGMNDRWDEAAEVLDRVDPEHKEEELDLLHQDVTDSEGTSWRELLRPGLRGALIAGVGLAVFQQFVGPNTVLFYTPTIFGYAGVSGNSLLPTIYVGATLFVFVLPDDRVRQRGRPQEAVLSGAGRDGIDARAPRRRVRRRAEELGRRRPDHPAGLRGVLLAVHLAAVLADDRGSSSRTGCARSARAQPRSPTGARTC